MSEVDGFVILKKGNLVSMERWRDAVMEHGFALELLDDVDWTKGAGRVRCRYFGNHANFEYTLAPLDHGWLDQAKMKYAGMGDTGDADTLVTFASSTESGSELFPTVGDFYAMGIAFIAAAVLAELSGGLLVEDSDRLAVGPDMAAAYGRYREHSIMQFIYERNFDAMMFMPTPREIMPVLQSRRLQAVLAHQVEIFAAIFRDWMPSAAERAELGALEKELRQIADESEAILGTTGLRAWWSRRMAGLDCENEKDNAE
jgi:hypothetical protein